MPKAERKAELAATSGVDVRTCIRSLAALSTFAEALDTWNREGSICWEGVWLQGLSPLVAASLEVCPVPQLLILPTPTDAETVARDLEYLLGRIIEIFPAGSDDTEVESLLQQEILQRLQVVSRLYRFQPSHDRAQEKTETHLRPPESLPPIVVTTLPALMQAVPSPSQLHADRKMLSVGMRCDVAEIRAWLVETGYHSTTSVQLPGEFTVRGGILDIYPPDTSVPYRIEWFDDDIESIRTFDVATQRSIERTQSIDLIAAGEATADTGNLIEYLPPDAKIWIHEPKSIEHMAQAFLSRVPFPQRFRDGGELLREIRTKCHATTEALASEGYRGSLFKIPIGDVQRVGGELENIAKDVDHVASNHRPVLLVCVNEGEVERMRDLLATSQAAKEGRVHVTVGGLANGFEIPPDGPIVLTVNQLLRRAQLRRSSRKIPSRAIDSFLDLREGDLIVHLSHGIGVYRGMTLLEKHGLQQEHLELEFDEGTKLYVPTSKIDLVQRYVGGTKSKPKLAKIGSQSWGRQKKAAEEAVTDMAAELLELHARRKGHAGIAFSEDTVWQHQFDASFPYEETPDQLSAIEALKKDMQVARPMDRLICGDVGFGKTEVAMRAAFKAIDSGYQVAVLVPTTVLAEQHYKTFRERMAEFPFDIERISRFRTTAEQKETCEGWRRARSISSLGHIGSLRTMCSSSIWAWSSSMRSSVSAFR